MPRSRSRSPHRESRHSRSHRHRSRSPRRSDTHRRDHQERKRHQSPPRAPVRLPLRASTIYKDDFEKHKPVFALYLDVQKQILIEELDDHEVRGRWKSFVKKWNRGELAEGWYDPDTHAKANASATTTKPEPPGLRESPSYESREQAQPEEEDSNDDDDIGPALPDKDYHNDRRSGPGMPKRQDLALRDELTTEHNASARASLQHARRLDRLSQKERLNDLAPRADPGTRERQLEKKRETTAATRSFREAKSPGAEEVRDGDLLGGDDGDGLRALKRDADKARNERAVRKEEVLRARAAEREERFAEHRAKEEKTMEMLRTIAKQRFG